jgi:hypothetical protein
MFAINRNPSRITSGVSGIDRLDSSLIGLRSGSGALGGVIGHFSALLKCISALCRSRVKLLRYSDNPEFEFLSSNKSSPAMFEYDI